VKKTAVAFILFSILIFLGLRCGPKKNPNFGSTSTPRYNLHVYNGSKVAFYTATGQYAFSDQASSVFSFSQSLGTAAQMVQDSLNGYFFIGTSSCSSGCNDVVFMDGLKGFHSANFSASVQTFSNNGHAMGVAVNPAKAAVYAADPTVPRIYYMNEATLGFGTGGNTGIVPPSGSNAEYLGADSSTDRLLVTDTLLGSVYFLDGSSGTLINPPGDLSVASQCAAGNLSYVAVNSNLHMGYVLCADKILYFNTGVTPGWGIGAAVGTSTLSLAPITSAADVAVNSTSNTVVVVGNQYVSLLSGSSGTTITTADLAAACGVTPDLRGVAYDASSDTIFVSDYTNSKVYLLKGSDATPKTGSCSSSSFSTATDVPNPTKMTFY
jgi:hypothetical protein